MRRAAVIDVGTNTALLLVAELSEDDKLVVLQTARRFVRLGQGIDESGRINVEAIQRLLSALGEFRAIISGVDVIKVVGTSASRDAANIEEVATAVRAEFGWNYVVLSGNDEARFTHAGAISEVDSSVLEGKPLAVVDIGGGSTEVTFSHPGALAPSFCASLQIGTVRLAERLVSAQPVSETEQQTVTDVIRSALVSCDFPKQDNLLLVGAAGTSVTLALLDIQSSRTSAGRNTVLPHFVSREALGNQKVRLCRSTFEEILAMDEILMHGRADVIPVGAIILNEIVEHLAVSGVLVSPSSLRHGIAMDLLGG